MTLALSMRVCVNGYMYMCVFVLCTCMHTPQTTPHHPLTRWQWFVFIYQTVYGVQRAPTPHRAVGSQWPSAPLSVSPGPPEVLTGTTGGAGTRGWGLSDAQMHSSIFVHSDVCVHACTRVSGTQYYMCLVLIMWPHMRPTPPQLCPPHPIMHLGVGVGEGHRWWNTYINYT